jgi:glycosyltransferase involved in cell wall biosynthesis
LLYTFYSSWPDELMLKRSPWPLAARRAAALLYRAIERRAVGSASVVTVLSEYSRADVRRLYGREPVLIPGGVDSGRFRPSGSPARDGKVRLVTLRNLVPRMGLGELVGAMKLLPARVELDIGGEGPLRADLARRIGALGLASRVRLRGHIPDPALPEFYSRADWFVLPTAALEGFGLVVLESLACGTPVLGTRIGAIPELLERFEPRWVIPSPDAETIASSIASALELERPPREELHRRVASEFDWGVIAGRYLELYDALAGRSGSRPPTLP